MGLLLRPQPGPSTAAPPPRYHAAGSGPLAITLVVALALGLRFAAWSPFALLHADEMLQYLEQAHRLATGHGIVPWESRAGLRHGLIPQILSVPMRIGLALAPGTLAGLYLARITFAILTLCALPAAWRLGALTSRRHALAALFVTAVWWECILYSQLVLSESLAASLLLLAASFLLDEKAGSRSRLAGGLLLGLGVLVRLQYAPFAAVLFAWTCWRTPRATPGVLAGGAFAAIFGAASDLFAGLTPYSWVVTNVTINILEGKAASFGTSPAWQYLADLPLHFGAGALLLALVCACASGRATLPLAGAALLNLLVHSLIAHKEFRFIWVSVLVLVVLAAIGSVTLADRLMARHRSGKLQKADLALTGALVLWSLASFTSERITGGYAAFRGGQDVVRMAIRASEDPRTCRLAITQPMMVHVLPVMLQRQVPLSVMPTAVSQGQAPLPPNLARAANTLLALERPEGTHAYRRAQCITANGDQICIYRRPGTCTGDPVHGFQAVLERLGK